MSESLLDSFRNTEYLVCLDPAAWYRIDLDHALPSPLQTVVGERAWGFITAWNPQARADAPASNLARQRELLAALRTWPDVAIYPAIGIGRERWNEPSLFVIGPDCERLDQLACEHRQVGYLLGKGSMPARLRILPP